MLWKEYAIEMTRKSAWNRLSTKRAGDQETVERLDPFEVFPNEFLKKGFLTLSNKFKFNPRK